MSPAPPTELVPDNYILRTQGRELGSLIETQVPPLTSKPHLFLRQNALCSAATAANDDKYQQGFCQAPTACQVIVRVILHALSLPQHRLSHLQVKESNANPNQAGAKAIQ